LKLDESRSDSIILQHKKIMLENSLSKFPITIFTEILKQYSIEEEILRRRVSESLVVFETVQKFPAF
jgi:hypothetical protein